jgi:hypothetical protein
MFESNHVLLSKWSEKVKNKEKIDKISEPKFLEILKFFDKIKNSRIVLLNSEKISGSITFLNSLNKKDI